MANFNGYINLMQFAGTQYLTVNGTPCIVIPAGRNNIRVEKNEQSGNLSATVGIKADSVEEQYRTKERENHQNDIGWDESKLTSHLLIRTYQKDFREKVFARIKEQILKEKKWEEIIPMMEKVLKRDGSEGIASVENERAWQKLCWQELDRRSRIGRLSQVVSRTVEAQASGAVNAQEANIEAPFDESDLPF